MEKKDRETKIIPSTALMPTISSILVIRDIVELIKQDTTIIATIISYVLYLIALFFILKGTNKLLEKSKQKGKISSNVKVLKSLKRSTIASCLVIFIFKFLLIYNTSRSIKKGTLLILFAFINYKLIHCLYVSDIEKINSFKSLFLINQNNIESNQNNIETNQNKFYEILYIIFIIILISILTYLIAICLGIDLNQFVYKLFTNNNSLSINIVNTQHLC